MLTSWNIRVAEAELCVGSCLYRMASLQALLNHSLLGGAYGGRVGMLKCSSQNGVLKDAWLKKRNVRRPERARNEGTTGPTPRSVFFVTFIKFTVDVISSIKILSLTSAKPNVLQKRNFATGLMGLVVLALPQASSSL